MSFLDPAAPDPEGPWRDVVIRDIPLRVFTAEQELVLSGSKEGDPSSLSPSPNSQHGHFICAAELTTLSKSFNDGLYAAVELWLQEHGKGQLIDSVRRAHPVVAAAAELGGGRVVPPDETDFKAERDAFLAVGRRSQPTGFYTWSEALTRVFRQDRLLQSPLLPASDPRVAALVRTLHYQPDQRRVYERTLRLAERLTNPFVPTDFRPWLRSLDAGFPYSPPRTVAWLPRSTSHEEQLATRLPGTGEAPEGFDLMEELIRRVRSGALTLEPGPDSGWYDHQTWAQAALLTLDQNEEAAKLKVSPLYRDYLESLFKGGLTLLRETHTKQLGLVDVACAMLDEPPPRIEVYVGPDLAVEPLVTHYDRCVSAYRFVRRLLEEELGTQALETMRRTTPEGPMSEPLGEELENMERLFDTAAGLARVGLGLPSSVSADRAAQFAHRVRSHPDLRRDTRVMAPVSFDTQRQLIKVWCVLGWTTRSGTAKFHVPPKVRCRSAADCDLYFRHEYLAFAEPVMVELYTERLLDRDEFRRLCDRERTAERIVRAISAPA